MGNDLDFYFGQYHGLQSAQHTEFGFWITHAVEHHDAKMGCHVDGVTAAPKDATKIGEAQFFPDFGQRSDVAQVAAILKGEMTRKLSAPV